MKVVHFEDVPLRPVDMEGAVGCQLRVLVGQEDGAPNFTMRQFEVAAGGHTPLHSHGYEHEVYILEGEGTVQIGDCRYPLRPGSVVFVPAGVIHQFRNEGAGVLRFLCLIPNPVRAVDAPCVAACCPG
ncbi:MAG: cupin domain-containing protein [Thermoguttaceae bacterium]|nr:cupin domain-containing protein [Thermoguttaceae bacterium]MDW8078985.1 cupin domain-containing protein [Thermoguttaceae bacterium]